MLSLQLGRHLFRQIPVSFPRQFHTIKLQQPIGKTLNRIYSFQNNNMQHIQKRNLSTKFDNQIVTIQPQIVKLSLGRKILKYSGKTILYSFPVAGAFGLVCGILAYDEKINKLNIYGQKTEPNFELFLNFIGYSVLVWTLYPITIGYLVYYGTNELKD